MKSIKELADELREAGVEAIAFAPDGGIVSMKLTPTYNPPPKRPEPLTPEQQEIEKRNKKKAKAKKRMEEDQMQFAASEGYPTWVDDIAPDED